MAKWLKLDTDILDDEKITVIRSYPDGDSIVILWIGLLCMAMKKETDVLYVAESTPLSPEILSKHLDIPLKTVQLGLDVFVDLNMISVLEDMGICITNLANHQSLDKLEHQREMNAERVRRHRKKQKEIPDVTGGVTHYTVTGNGDRLDETRLDKTRTGKSVAQKHDPIPFKVIIDYLNDKFGTNYNYTTKKTQALIKARWADGFRLDDFKSAIAWCQWKWKGDAKMTDYLRPQTVFTGNMEAYIENFKREGDDGN